MNVIEKIKDVVSILNEIDEYSNGLANKLSLCDNKICDLMHLIEFNNLSTKQRYRVIGELHKIRVERRNIKNDMSTLRIYNNNSNKLLEANNRQFLLSEIHKTLKYQQEAQYTNRVYTDEEIKELIGE